MKTNKELRDRAEKLFREYLLDGKYYLEEFENTMNDFFDNIKKEAYNKALLDIKQELESGVADSYFDGIYDRARKNTAELVQTSRRFSTFTIEKLMK